MCYAFIVANIFSLKYCFLNTYTTMYIMFVTTHNVQKQNKRRVILHEKCNSTNQHWIIIQNEVRIINTSQSIITT